MQDQSHVPNMHASCVVFASYLQMSCKIHVTPHVFTNKIIFDVYINYTFALSHSRFIAFHLDGFHTQTHQCVYENAEKNTCICRMCFRARGKAPPYGICCRIVNTTTKTETTATTTTTKTTKAVKKYFYREKKRQNETFDGMQVTNIKMVRGINIYSRNVVLLFNWIFIVFGFPFTVDNNLSCRVLWILQNYTSQTLYGFERVGASISFICVAVVFRCFFVFLHIFQSIYYVILLFHPSCHQHGQSV